MSALLLPVFNTTFTSTFSTFQFGFPLTPFSHFWVFLARQLLQLQIALLAVAGAVISVGRQKNSFLIRLHLSFLLFLLRPLFFCLSFFEEGKRKTKMLIFCFSFCLLSFSLTLDFCMKI